MQFQIPQFIETEDKIVGPLSLRQFIYVGTGVGFSMMLYFIISFWTWFPIATVLTVGSISLAFIKVNGRSLSTIAYSAAQYFWRPRLYLWQSETPKIQTKDQGKPSSFSLENIMAGLSLSKSWQRVQTGTVESNTKIKQSISRLKEKYQVFSRISGEREAAKRVDYR